MAKIANLLLIVSMICFIPAVIVAITLFTGGFSWIWEFALMVLGAVVLAILIVIIRDRQEKKVTEKYGE